MDLAHDDPSSRDSEGIEESSVCYAWVTPPSSFDSSTASMLSPNKENEVTLENLESFGIKFLIQKFPDEGHMEIISRIEQSWQVLQLPPQELEKRLQVISDGIGDNLSKILQHALELQNAFQENLQQRVTRYLNDIRDTQQLLNLQPESTSGIDSGSDVGLFEREIQLRARCNELLALRKKRQTLWIALMADNKKFSDATGLPGYFLNGDSLRLRTETLEDLQACNDDLQAVYVIRSNSMKALRTRIDALTVELRKEPAIFDWNKLTEENIHSAEGLLNELNLTKAAHIVEGNSILSRIKYLCRRTSISSVLLESQPGIIGRLYDPDVIGQLTEERDRLELEAKQNIRTVILRHRDRILTLYDATFASPTERAAFADLTSDDFSEALLDSHEVEVNRLDECLENHRRVYALLSEHVLLMREKLKYEEQEMDPVVMMNRGGILLKIQADKKKIVKDLHKVTADLRAEVEKSAAPFRIEGLTLDDFLVKRQRDMEHEKADFLQDRKTAAAPGSARKAGAPGSAVKRAKDHKDKDTPTLKRLKNEVGAASGVKDPNDTYTVVRQPLSGKGEPKSSKNAKEPTSAKNTENRMTKIKRRLDFEGNSAGGSGKSTPRHARPGITPASSSTSINTTKGHK